MNNIMAINLRKKLFFMIFCLASITQGMYSTYFVSILTTIERVYQIQSKTAGAILSATEIGQILGSLLIAYYGGRGNKPKWIAACMTLSALAALISISPHFLLYTSSTNNNKNINIGIYNQSSIISSSSSSPYTTSDLTINSTSDNNPLSSSSSLLSRLSELDVPSPDQFCYTFNLTEPMVLNSTHESAKDTLDMLASPSTSMDHSRQTQSSAPFGLILMIFFTCLLAIGFGSTAITTLGIPFIDDIVSKEDSPLYLGLTIGLRIFGPALGFLLGSFCINLNLNPNVGLGELFGSSSVSMIVDESPSFNHFGAQAGAWWLGLIIISVPLLILALPMYYLSRMIDNNDGSIDDYGDITYQAAEDHDIGGSHDFQSHMLGLGGIGADLADITSNRTCFSSEIDSSSREVLQSHGSPTMHQYHPYHNNYGRNLAMEEPMLSDELKKARLLTSDDVDAGLNNVDSGAGGQYGPLSLEAAGKSNADNDTNWRSNICVVVNHFGGLDRANFTNDEEARCLNNDDQTACARSSSSSSSKSSTSSSRSFIVSSIVPPSYKNHNNNGSSNTSTTNNNNNNNNNAKQSQQQLQQQQPLIQQSTLADLSSTLSRLIKNKLLLLRMLSGILHILPIAGFYTFFPKYLIEQFRITTSSASAISGLAGILFVGIGAFLGGTIVRLFNVNSRLMTRWIATSALLYTIGMLVLMNLGCTNNQTIHYESIEFMTTDCSTSCKCSNTIYNPVCANGTTYISPCLAGCRNYTISGGKIIYDECGCSAAPPPQPPPPPPPPPIAGLFSTSYNNISTTSIVNATSSGVRSIDEQPQQVDSISRQDLRQHSRAPDNHVNLNVATPGHCLIDCDNLKWYIIIFSISTLIHASCEVGSMMFNLRCVNSADRTLALGLTTFSSSLLGTIPCSVIYGTIVDLTCVHWDSLAPGAGSESAARGACRAYENDSFRYYLHGLTALVMFLAFIVDCFISRRASEVDFYDGNDSRTDIRMELKKSTETI